MKFSLATRAATAPFQCHNQHFGDGDRKGLGRQERHGRKTAKPDSTRGRPLCGGRPVSSTGLRFCRRPGELNLVVQKKRQIRLDGIFQTTRTTGSGWVDGNIPADRMPPSEMEFKSIRTYREDTKFEY